MKIRPVGAELFNADRQTDITEQIVGLRSFFRKRQIKLLQNNWYTGCPRRNVRDFGRVFLMLNYTDITQNTYIQSWTVTEIMAIE